jgi:hypothetical protein
MRQLGAFHGRTRAAAVSPTHPPPPASCGRHGGARYARAQIGRRAPPAARAQSDSPSPPCAMATPLADTRRGSAPGALDGAAPGDEPLAQFAAVKERYLSKASEAPRTPCAERLESELPPPGSASGTTSMWLQLEELRRGLAKATAETEAARKERAAKEVELRAATERVEAAERNAAEAAELRAERAQVQAALDAATAGAPREGAQSPAPQDSCWPSVAAHACPAAARAPGRAPRAAGRRRALTRACPGAAPRRSRGHAPSRGGGCRGGRRGRSRGRRLRPRRRRSRRRRRGAGCGRSSSSSGGAAGGEGRGAGGAAQRVGQCRRGAARAARGRIRLAGCGAGAQRRRVRAAGGHRGGAGGGARGQHAAGGRASACRRGARRDASRLGEAHRRLPAACLPAVTPRCRAATCIRRPHTATRARSARVSWFITNAHPLASRLRALSARLS